MLVQSNSAGNCLILFRSHFYSMNLTSPKAKHHSKEAARFLIFSSVKPLSLFSPARVCKFLFAIWLIMHGSTVYSQKVGENNQPILKGQVLGMEDLIPVTNAIVTNQRTKLTVNANQDGLFEIDALNTDSLEISSLGYSKEIIAIPSDYNTADILIVYAKPIRYILPDVGVKGNYPKLKLKVENIKVSPYFRNEIMDEKPAQEKAYQNQISFLKIPLYGESRPDREAKAANNADKQWAVVSKIYNVELVRGLTGLNATEADRFMMYLNSKKLFDKTITKEYASYIILEQFKQYREEGH
jgi:hypothetical protein